MISFETGCGKETYVDGNPANHSSGKRQHPHDPRIGLPTLVVPISSERRLGTGEDAFTTLKEVVSKS
jgi:hypothetical protein